MIVYFIVLLQVFVWNGFIKRAWREISESEEDFMKWLFIIGLVDEL